MGTVKDRVAIIGMGCTKFGELWDKSPEDLIIDAAYEAFEDAGVDRKDIQAGWVGTTMSGQRGAFLAQPLKLEYIPITRLENACATATDAFRNASYAVAAGIYDMVLVLGVEKLKDTGVSGLGGSERAGSSEVEPAVTPPVQFALAATRYFHHYGLTVDEGRRTLARITVKNHSNGSLNPKAHFRRKITIEQAMNSPIVAWPLGLFDCCGVSDGGAAAIITRPEIAKEYRDDYLMVKGLGVTSGANQSCLRQEYDFLHFEETVTAGQIAYKEAGITKPREQIDLAVVHDCFSITELLVYEDLSFSERGMGPKDVHDGFFDLDGGLPVNTDGGLKCFGHPVGASGLRMIYEIYKQVQGKAGDHQLPKADIGLTHNLGGLPGTFTGAVSIFGRPD